MAEAGSGAGEPVSVFRELEADDPTQLGGYPLVAQLGAGGMGKVYLAHTLAGRPVAIKAIRPDLVGDPEFRHRFRREVAAAQRAHGLHTAPVIDSEIDSPPLWLATAFVPGPTLAAAVSRHGTLPVSAVLLLAAGVAEALRAVHGEGIVHRDLKASNVLLAADGPRVIDFGIARAVDATSLTNTGVAMGTPAFMSPEQAVDAEVGPATDVFSLGQLVTYAAKGAPAFGQGQAHSVLYRIVHEEPDLAEVPEVLLPLLNRCLTKDPAERPTPVEVIDLCRAASEDGTLRRSENWLPEAVTTELTRYQDVPRQALAVSDAVSVRNSGQPTANGETVTLRKRRNPVAGNEGQRALADTPQPVRRSTSRRALLALGATALVGAGSTAVIAQLSEESDAKDPEDSAPKRPAPRTTATLRVPDSANAVAFGPDGETLVTGSADARVRLWDVATGEITATLTGHSHGTVGSVAFSPDGETLATGSDDGTARLWEVATGENTTTLTDHEGPVGAVAFSPNGRTLASGGNDGTVRLWEVATGESITTLTGHKGSVDAVEFLYGGEALASGGYEGTVRLWNVATGESTAALTGHQDMVAAVAFSLEGKVLASGSRDGTVRLWDVAAGETRATLTGHKDMVAAVAFSPDGRTLASGSWDGTVRLWDVATAETAATLDHKDFVVAVAFDRDGRTLATGSGRTVRLWKASGGARISAARAEK